MSYTATQFCDCQSIIKLFEKAAATCPTEESVYAMLSVVLQNMRTSSGAFVEQSELDLITANPTSTKTKNQGSEEQSTNIGINDDKATEDDGGIVQTVRKNVTDTLEDVVQAFSQPPQETVDQIEAQNWYKDCINCDIRLTSWEELKLQVYINGFQNPFLQAFEAMYLQALQQIEKMKELFDSDPYLDLCVFIKWINDFVCLPDLARIVAVLMALLSKMAFDFGGVVGIIISLVAPLIQPFLSNLVNSLQQYIFMIIKPIECILDKLQLFLSYGDVLQAMEANLASVNLPFSTRRDGKVTGKADFGLFSVDLHEQGSATTSLTSAATTLVNNKLDVNISIQDRIDVRKAENQAKVDKAAKRLEEIDKAAGKMDLSNPGEVENYNNLRKEAKDNYQKAVDERDLSHLQRANKRITETRETIRSIILQFMSYLREAVQSVEAYINQLWDELKKLTLEFGGGHTSFLADLIKKMGIVQIIQLVYALIKNAGLKGCDDPDRDTITSDDVDFGGIFSQSQSGLTAYVDEDGNVHIEDNNDGLTDAIDAVVEAFGSDTDSPVKPGTTSSDKPTPPKTNETLNNETANTAARAKNVGGDGAPLSTLANKQDLRQTDKGNSVTEARQKLNSLIQLTGDPVLDSQIARATEAVVSRTNITFKCPLQTSVANAEQVNKWISELNE